MGRVDWLLEAQRSCDDRYPGDADLISSNGVRLTNERELGGRSSNDAKRNGHHA